MPKKKEGERGLNRNLIILIIAGVIVIAFVIFGFVFGWQKIFSWSNKAENVNVEGAGGSIVEKKPCGDLGGGRTTLTCDGLSTEQNGNYEDITFSASDANKDEGIYCCKKIS